MNKNKIEKLTQHINESKEILKKEIPSECWKQIDYIKTIYDKLYNEKFYIDYPYVEYGINFGKPLENDIKMIECLKKMIEKMEIYLTELKDENEQIKEDKNLININNNNTNTANATIFQNITIDQVLKELNKISDNILDKDKKEEIKNLLLAIDNLKEKDKAKTKEKIFSILKYLSDKSIDAFITLLPYLGQIAGALRR